jgi:hypothetical protein
MFIIIFFRPNLIIICPGRTSEDKHSGRIVFFFLKDDIYPDKIGLQGSFLGTISMFPGFICKDCGDTRNDFSLHVCFGNKQSRNYDNKAMTLASFSCNRDQPVFFIFE